MVVVGGGFTGLSAALALAERGARVILCEAENIGYGASGRNGGQVNPGLKPDPDETLRRYGQDLGARMVALAGTAPDVVFGLVERHRIDCDARRCGTLRAATHPRHVAAVRATTGQYLRLGAPVEMLSRARVAAETGTDRYHGAMLDRRGGALQPLKFARGLARAAIGAGATLHGGTRILGLQPAAGGWIARSTGGSVRAAQVLIATNGYSDGLWPGLRRSIVPVFSSIAATEPLPEAVARGIMPGGQVLWESGAVTVYYRLDSARRLLIGGRGPMREVDAPSDLAWIVRHARRLWPSLDRVSWTHAWGGQLAITPDHLPHVHAPAPGVWILLGYSGRGVALATALGAHLARKMAVPDAGLDMPLSGIKTMPLHSLWPLGVKAMILKGRISDFLGL